MDLRDALCKHQATELGEKKNPTVQPTYSETSEATEKSHGETISFVQGVSLLEI